jgi:hypothetical protein
MRAGAENGGSMSFSQCTAKKTGQHRTVSAVSSAQVGSVDWFRVDATGAHPDHERLRGSVAAVQPCTASAALQRPVQARR